MKALKLHCNYVRPALGGELWIVIEEFQLKNQPRISFQKKPILYWAKWWDL